MGVSGALGLDVACSRHEALQDEGASSQCCGLEGGGGPDLVIVVQHSDAAPTTAVGALESDRVAMGAGKADDGLSIGD